MCASRSSGSMWSEVIRLARVSAVALQPPSRAAAAGWRCSAKLDRLHHLADEAIGEHDDRIAIAIGKFEGQGGQVGHLLHGIGREHDGAVVAVAAALHHLVIIALLGRRCCRGRGRRA